MTSETQYWLPPDALAPERLEPLIEKLVGEWAGTWFASARPILRASFQDDWPSDAKGRWRSAGGAVSVEMTAASEAALAGAMLASPVPSSLQPAERTIVSELARAAADDLALRFAAMVRRGSGAAELSNDLIEGGGRLSWWTVGLGQGKRPFKLALSSGAAAALCRRALAQPKRGRPVTLRKALASQQVDVSANVGSCTLALAELRALVIGDVLVLDRALGATLDILVNGRPSALRASIEAKEGKPALLLV